MLDVVVGLCIDARASLRRGEELMRGWFDRSSGRRSRCAPRRCGSVGMEHVRVAEVLVVVVLDACLHQPLRIVVVDDHRAGVLVERPDDLWQQIGDSATAFEHADEPAFVVHDRKLPQCARLAADNEDDVRRTDVDHFTTHESGAGVDQDVEAVRG